MLVNNVLPYSLSIKNDGWNITADPSGNPTPYNYNERDVSPGNNLNQTLTWTVTAPSTPGTYYIKAHARHGNGGSPKNRNITTAQIDITTIGVTPEFPLGSTLAFSISAIIYILVRKKLE
jgi:hypothetical protein